MSFNKIFLLTFSFLALTLSLSVATQVAHSAELPNVYVEELTKDLPTDTYSPGNDILGSFVLRNADPVDATNIYYSVTIVNVVSEENDQKKFNYLSKEEFGPINIPASSKSEKIDFSIKVPENASGSNIEVRVEALSNSKIAVSWSETEKFSVNNPNQLVMVDNTYIELSNEQKHSLNYGPTIYSDHNPKAATLVATLSTNKASLTVFPEISITNWPKKEEVSRVQAPEIVVSSATDFRYDLPNFNYKPGVYEGIVQLKDSSGNKLSADLSFRYIVNGSIVTVHSLSSSVQEANKGEGFVVTAHITGNPVDLDRGGTITYDEEVPDASDIELTETPSLDQAVTLMLEVRDGNNKLVASAEKSADLSKESEFKFDLTSEKTFDYLVGKIIVKKGDMVLAEYDAPLSAHEKSVNDRTLIYSLIAILVLLVIIIIIKKVSTRNQLPVTILVIALSAGALFFLSTSGHINKASANHATPVAQFTYDLNESRHIEYSFQWVWNQALRRYTHYIYSVQNDRAQWTNQASANGIRVSSPAVDARIPVGSTFTISGSTINEACSNNNDDFWFKIYPESESWVKPTTSDPWIFTGISFVRTGGEIYTSHVFNFNKTDAVAPTTPGVYKLWVGSQRISSYPNRVNYPDPFARFFAVGYQTYTVVPTTPTNFTVTPNGCNGVIDLAWGASTGATEYRIFKSEDGGTTFSTSPIATIPVPGLTHTDNVNIADNTKSYVYRIVAVHAPTGIVSDPAEKALVKPANCPDGLACGAYSDEARTQQETQFDIGDTVYFKASATGGSRGYNYTWTGVASSNGALAQNQYSAEGRYPTNVTVTDSNQANLTDSCVIDVYVGGICDANKDCRRNSICTNGRCRSNGGDGDPDTISCAIEGNPDVPTGIGTHNFKWNLNITNGKSPFTVTWNITGTTPASETNTTSNRQDSVTRTVDTSVVATYRPEISVVDGNGRSIDMSKYPACPAATTQCIPPTPIVGTPTLTPRIVPIGGRCNLGFEADGVVSCRVHDVVRNRTVTGLNFTTATGALGSITQSGISVPPGIYTVICESPAVCGGQQATIRASAQVQCTENIDIKEN